MNTTLTSLYLGYNEIGAEGAGRIADSLKVNSTLTSFYLELNKIGDEGAGRIVESLLMNIALTYLKLVDRDIGDEGARTLFEAWKTNIGVKTIVGVKFQQVTTLGKLNEEFEKTTSNPQKYHICQIVSHIYRSDITPQMQEFKQTYEKKSVPKLFAILSAPIIYKDDAVLKQIITNKVNLFDSNVFTMIGQMLDKDALVSFKMAIDDALAGQNNQSHIDEHGDEVKISGSHDSHNGDDF